MIEEVVPSAVHAVETRGDPWPMVLSVEEEAAIFGAVRARRQEYATVRSCARRALVALGAPPAPVLNGLGGAPTWPDGVVGSMTHCLGYRAAAVAWSRTTPVLGIDAEPAQPVSDGILMRITSSRERRMLTALEDRMPSVAWRRLLFSVKESTYKAWSPRMHAPLSFAAAEVHLDPDRTVRTSLPPPGLLIDGVHVSSLTGRWATDGRHVVTAIWH